MALHCASVGCYANSDVAMTMVASIIDAGRVANLSRL
jgi:hypothetical protein